MKPAFRRFPLPLLLLALSLPAAAADIACPDLTGAVQVGQCPGEDELRYTFNGYCSDNSRIYGKGAELCTDYRLYRKQKNVALWESADGNFHAYLSCDLSPATVKAAKVKDITLGKERKMTRLVCGYSDGISFAHHGRENCRVDAAACAADPAACTASCD